MFLIVLRTPSTFFHFKAFSLSSINCSFILDNCGTNDTLYILKSDCSWQSRFFSDFPMLVPFHLSHHSASTAVSRGFFSLETLGVGLKFKVLGLQLAVIRDKLISLSLNFLIYKGKESACNTGDAGLIPGSVRSPWRRKWQSTPVFSPGEIYGLAPVHRFLQARILAPVHGVTRVGYNLVTN